MAAPSAAPSTYKFVHGDDIRRWTPAPPGPVTFEGLVAKAEALYGLAGFQLQLKFQDTDGDKVTLACESDLAELFLLRLPVARVFVAKGAPQGAPQAPKAASPAADSQPRAEPADPESGEEEGEGDSAAAPEPKFGPKRLRKYLANLAAAVSDLASDQSAGSRVALLLDRGSRKADARGQDQAVACLRQAAAKDPELKAKLEALAGSRPADLGLPSLEEAVTVPAGARALAARALLEEEDNPAPLLLGSESQQPPPQPPPAPSSDSEDSEGVWSPRRAAKVADKLAGHLGALEASSLAPAPFAPVRLLMRAAAKTDAAGRGRVVAALRAAAEANEDGAGAFLELLANNPAQLGVRRWVMPARALAAEALGLPDPRNRNPSKPEEEDDGKPWRPARVEKFLARLAPVLSGLAANPGTFQPLRMLSRAYANTDDAGRAAVAEYLKGRAEEEPAVASLLHKAAHSPQELGLRRDLPPPARAMAVLALGGDPARLPAPHSGPALHRGVTCGGCGVRPIAGTRYASDSRPGFDLCASCVSAPDAPWADDAFTAVERPAGGRKGPRGFNNNNNNSSEMKPQVRLVEDVTHPDGAVLAPGQAFTKVWRVRNSGQLPWDPRGAGLALVHVGGDRLGAPDAPVAQCVAPGGAPPAGQTAELSVELVAPEQPGRYEAFFRMARNAAPGQEPFRFGQRIWARILVVAPAAAEEKEEEVPPKEDAVQMEAINPMLAAGLMAGIKMLPEEHQSSSGPSAAAAAAGNDDGAGGDWVDVTAPAPAMQ